MIKSLNFLKSRLEKWISEIAHRLHISPKSLIRSSLIALIITLISFPIRYYWISPQSLPVEVKLAAPGGEVVKAYWDNPQTHPERYHPIIVKPVARQNWNIKIEALGEKHSQSNGYEVVLLDIRTPEKQVDWSQATFRGNWEMRDSPNSPQNKAPVAHSYTPEYGLHPREIQSVEVQLEGGELEIKLFGHGGAGKTKITVGDRKQELDLYRREGFEEILKFPPFAPDIGDNHIRTYQINAIWIPCWSKLKFLADTGEVIVQEVKIDGRVIPLNPNGEYILPYRQFLVQSIFSSLIIFILIQFTFINVLQLYKKVSYQHFIRAFFLTLPALVSVILLQKEVPFYTFLFQGGRKVFLSNLCCGILFFYLVIFLLALGSLLLPSPPKTIHRYLSKADVELLRFFNGASILMLLGFVLGFAKLLTPLITISIFVIIIYIYFLHYPNILVKLWTWLQLKESVIQKKNSFSRKPRYHTKILQVISSSLHFLFIFLVIHILLARGIFLDLMSSDVQQLYFSYFNEVRRLQGIWIDSEVPIIGDFLAGRGNGVHLFFTSFTNQYFIQIIGVMYFVTLAILAYRIVTKFCDWCDNLKMHFFIRNIFPISAAFFVLTSSIQEIDIGKYHIQTGAFFVCITFYSSHFLFLKRQQQQWLLFALLPMTFALAIAISQTTPIFCFFFIESILIVYLVRRKTSFTVPYTILIITSIIGTFVSLLINQIYIGIAELSPWYLFIKFANLERFQQWSSIEQYVFLGLIHEVFPFHLSFSYIFKNYFFKADLVLNTIFCFFLALNFFLSFFITRKKLRKNKRWIVSLKTKLNLIFVFILFSIYPIGIFFMSYASQGSAIRIFSFLPFYSVIGLFGMIIFFLQGYIFSNTSTFQKNKPFQKRISFSQGFLSCLLLLLSIFMELYRKTPLYNNSLSSKYRYFLGRDGIIESIPSERENHLKPFSKSDFYRPLEIKKNLPLGGRILPLNATATIIPSQHSPLLPRGMIIHHYQSDISAYYGKIVLDSPANAYKILRLLDIDFFYVEKDNIEFYAPGYSESFSFNNLVKNFDIFYEGDRFIILTWRGQGIKPVDLNLASYIEGLREEAKTSNPYYRKCWLALVTMKQEYKRKKSAESQ